MPEILTPAVVTVLFLAVVLFLLARILRATVFGGIVRGLSMALALVCVVTILSGTLLRSREVLKILDVLLPAVTVCLVVLFQPEIRRALLRIGRPLAPPVPGVSPGSEEEVVRAVEWLSRDRLGALIAWERTVGLGELTSTGVPLDAEVRAETLVAIFSPSSPLHDGALVLRGNRIAAAACVLPLSEGQVDAVHGLRHRAALGLTEQTDAVVVVVSEETGAVSVARDGRLEALGDPASLAEFMAGPSGLRGKAS